MISTIVVGLVLLLLTIYFFEVVLGARPVIPIVTERIG